MERIGYQPTIVERVCDVTQKICIGGLIVSALVYPPGIIPSLIGLAGSSIAKGQVENVRLLQQASREEQEVSGGS